MGVQTAMALILATPMPVAALNNGLCVGYG